jgi:HPr kinase/phosphorylase
MAPKQECLVHGTCVALGNRAALLRGEPGTGKSDLALRFVSQFSAENAQLVADDQVRIAHAGGALIVSPPDSLAGRLEVRGIGIVAAPHVSQAELALIVALSPADAVPRLPPDPLPREDVLGVPVPVLALDPLPASAAAKLRLALAGGL